MTDLGLERRGLLPELSVIDDDLLATLRLEAHPGGHVFFEHGSDAFRFVRSIHQHLHTVRSLVGWLAYW